MSFIEEFDTLPLAALVQTSRECTLEQVKACLGKPRKSLLDFACLISPAAEDLLEVICGQAKALTRQRFGKVIRLFAPLYLSNECINSCRYCGFSRNNDILRVTLSLEEVAQEALAIKELGFRNVLLVAGEHPRFVSLDYLKNCVAMLHQQYAGVSLEVAPMDTAEYRELVNAGADGLTIYQETYDRLAYKEMHTAGPKKDFPYRLATPERAYAAGFRRIGIGALYGLADWRFDTLALTAHATYLLKHCWKTSLTISLPRLRPHAGHFEPKHHLTDRQMVLLTAVLRLCFPDVGLVLSTRESPGLRDILLQVGMTTASAGSHTEPGGYTGAGKTHLHPAKSHHSQATPLVARTIMAETNATEQFQIADTRSPAEIASVLRNMGYEPVWKDWDAALLN